jgi:tRNA (guanine-N7-)-methyltransferase
MRLKHIKGAEDIVRNSEYVIQTPDKYKGNYKKIFNNNNPIHIEIGMGKGNFILNMALRYPNINFIGIEKYDSVLVKAILKLESTNITNVKFIRMDANEIENVFDKEIDKIYLNFSDPWPKERHAKRRLTSSNFLNKYESIFKDTKNIIMKTDNRQLFSFSIKSFTEYGYHIEDISLDLVKDDIKDNIKTEYEEKFVNKGLIIYMIKVTK